MSLRITGLPPPATPTPRRTEVARRPIATPVDAPATPSVPSPNATGGAPPPVSALATEMKMDQWLSDGEVSAPLPAVPVPLTVTDSGSSFGGDGPATPAMVPDQAQQTAERVRENVLAQPPQASGIHGNLVAATVLNLLA